MQIQHDRNECVKFWLRKGEKKKIKLQHGQTRMKQE